MKVVVALALLLSVGGGSYARAQTPLPVTAQASLPQGVTETPVVIGAGETQVAV